LKEGRRKMSKDVGYALAILGIALIAIGALNVTGYLSFQVVDITPPTILYTYPADKMTYGASEINEIIIYARDNSGISSVSYYDKYGTKTLMVTPYTQLQHPLVIEGWKYPDVNFDGKVDSTDLNLVLSAYGKTINDTDFPEIYDLNSDGIIDMIDVVFISGTWINTYTYAISIVPSYAFGENVSFTFSAFDGCGNIATMSGSFNIQEQEYEQLLGTWKINDKTVTHNTLVTLSDKNVDIVFVCDDTTIPSENITVKATVGNIISYFTFVGNYTWRKTMEVPPGTSILILEASVQTATLKMNKIAVTISTPEPFTFTVGYMLILAGVISLIGGVIVIFKEKRGR
jgi:hypothetical protein